MKLLELIKTWRSRSRAASQRREKQQLEDSFYLTETTDGFFIMCNGTAVEHVITGDTLYNVRQRLEELRETAVKYHALSNNWR